jgi:hypothetical protein
MIEYCPETDIEFDATRFTSADKLRGAECFCSRATLDDLLSDEVMAPVLRSAGYEPAREHDPAPPGQGRQRKGRNVPDRYGARRRPLRLQERVA